MLMLWLKPKRGVKHEHDFSNFLWTPTDVTLLLSLDILGMYL